MMKFKKPYAFLVAGLLTLSIGASTLFNNTAEIESVNAASGDTYTLVNSTDQLEIGATYIFLSIDNDIAMSSQGNINYRITTGYTSSLYDESSKTFTAPDGVSEFELGGEENKYTFKDLETNKFLYLNSDSNNLCSGDNDSNGWAITFNGDIAKVVPNNYTERFINANISANPKRFACYKASSKQQEINLFKKVESSSTDVLESLDYDGTPVAQYNGRAFNPEGLTFHGTYSESGTKEIDISLITFTPETLTTDTTEVVATFSGVSVTISDIKVNVLEGVTYEGTPVDQYVNRPFDPTGLTFYANYSVTGKEELDASLLTFNPEVMSLDTNSVTVYYEDVSTVINNITVLDEDPRIFFGDHDDFTTWENQYLVHKLEYDDFKADFSYHTKQTSTITTMPVSKAGSVTITLNDSISATHEITYVEFGFVQWNTKKQTITLGDQTLSFPDDGTTISNTYSNHTTSVTAEATNSENQVGWEYVIVTIEELETTPLMEAEAFAQSVIDDLTCDPTGVTAPSKDEWSALADKYETLSEEAKALFVDTTESSVIKNALAKYDYILGKYGSEVYANFMNREVVSAANNITNPILNTTNNIIIIVSVCVLAISAIGVFIVISKKRKQINK